MKIEVYNNPLIHFDLELKYCGLENCSSNFVMNPHTRDCYLIHYITCGSGMFYCESNSYIIKKGDLFLITPGVLVSYMTNSDDPFSFCWFSFAGAKANTLLPYLGLSQNAPVRHLHSRYSITNLIRQCSNIFKSAAPHNDFIIHSILLQILSNLSDSYSMGNNCKKIKRNPAQDHIERAIAYIQFNYMNPITVQDISDYIGLERTYFSKIFHKYIGITAQKYLLRERISHSKYLLERTSYTLKEISAYIGIQDEYYFSRVFKSETGLSPKQYRLSIQE